MLRRANRAPNRPFGAAGPSSRPLLVQAAAPQDQAADRHANRVVLLDQAPDRRLNKLRRSIKRRRPPTAGSSQ